MALIRLSRDVQLNQSLINSRGERVDRIRLSEGFVVPFFGNEQSISYDFTSENYYLDIDSLLAETSLSSLSDVSLAEPLNNGDFLCYNGAAGVWTNCELDLSGIDNLANQISDLEDQIQELENSQHSPYETIDGNGIKAEAKDAYDVMMRNSNNTGYSWIPIGRLYNIFKEINRIYDKGITQTLSFEGQGGSGNVQTLVVKDGRIVDYTLY